MGSTESSTFSADLPHFRNADGARLYIRRWSPNGETRAVLFMCHGLGVHIGRFNPLSSALAGKGILVVGHDHVGHGRSEGIRLDCQDFHWYIRDVLQHVNMLKHDQPDVPFFLFGQSMGGAIALLTALESPYLFSGLILSAPMIKVNPEEATPIKVWLARVVASLFPQLCIGTMDCKLSNRDPEQVKAYEEDPLCHLGVKARWAVCALRAMEEIQQRTREITTPYLLIHGGDDKMILPEGSEQLHAESQSEDKTLKIYPGYYHDLLNEPKEYSDVVFNDITSWLEGHLG